MPEAHGMVVPQRPSLLYRSHHLLQMLKGFEAFVQDIYYV